VKSSLFSHLETAAAGERFALQNERLLRITLGPEVMARQGSMVAYQGGVQFDYQGSGGMGRFLKKALTGEGLPLMRCSGAGELFLARDAREIFLIQLEGDSLTVNGDNLLAFDTAIEWDIRRVEGVSVLAGGLFNTVLSGTGWVAISSFGTPVVLQTEVPTFADIQSAIAWSSSLQTSVQRTMKLGALVGRGSGEAAQLAFSGQGFVVVQASEGPSVPAHNHGG
jgi:uncharacterized protein (AIM24 family)